jgi:hypothetical protein
VEKTQARHRLRWGLAATGAAVFVAAGGFAAWTVVDGETSHSTASTTQPSTTKVQREIDQRLAVRGTPVVHAVAASAVQTGFERLLTSSAIAFTYTSQGTESGKLAATGVVVPPTRSLEIRRTTTLDSGGTVTDVRRVVNGIVYLRVIDQSGPTTWSTSPVSAEPQADFYLVLTAGGEADGSTNGLIDLLRTAPFSVTRLPGASTRYRFRLQASNVEAYYAAMGNVQPLPPNVEPVSAIEVTLGPDLTITALSAYGTVFDDGEAIGPAIIDIHYMPTGPQSIEAPPASEIRSP